MKRLEDKKGRQVQLDMEGNPILDAELFHKVESMLPIDREKIVEIVAADIRVLERDTKIKIELEDYPDPVMTSGDLSFLKGAIEQRSEMLNRIIYTLTRPSAENDSMRVAMSQDCLDAAIEEKRKLYRMLFGPADVFSDWIIEDYPAPGPKNWRENVSHTLPMFQKMFDGITDKERFIEKGREWAVMIKVMGWQKDMRSQMEKQCG